MTAVAADLRAHRNDTEAYYVRRTDSMTSDQGKPRAQ